MRLPTAFRLIAATTEANANLLTALGENVEHELEISSQAASELVSAASSETAEGLAKFARAMANGAPVPAASAGPHIAHHTFLE